jgi:hypothetical protein
LRILWESRPFIAQTNQCLSLLREKKERAGVMEAGKHRNQPTSWPWPVIDQPVDISTLLLREWKHAGDSPIIAGRPRTRRGAPLPQPAYLLKVGRDAIGERLYALAARHFALPSAIVTWTTASDLHEAAIRFEPGAWRPQRLDPALGVAIAAGRSVSLHNPLDYYRHLALSAFLDDYDGAEFLVSQGWLFRIDAAAVGWHLFDVYLRQVIQPEERHTSEVPASLSSLIQVTTEGIRKDPAPAYQVYIEMMAQIAAWTELPAALADDLRTCPAAACQLLPTEVQEALPQEIPSLADAVEAYLRQQQHAITWLFL